MQALVRQASPNQASFGFYTYLINLIHNCVDVAQCVSTFGTLNLFFIYPLTINANQASLPAHANLQTHPHGNIAAPLTPLIPLLICPPDDLSGTGVEN